MRSLFSSLNSTSTTNKQTANIIILLQAMAASSLSSTFLQLSTPFSVHPYHHQLLQQQQNSPFSRRLCVPRASADDDKSLELMRKFSEQYARRSGTYFCVDKGVTAVVIKGLAEHKDTLGAPLCPCRHYDDKEAEAQQGFWNCPCVPMRERKECHCMLFLTDDNDFAGKEQEITIDEIKDLTANF